MKTSELLRLLRKAGCYLVSNSGRHDCWFSPVTGKKFMVPRHPSHELPAGTANSILRDAGLSIGRSQDKKGD